MNISLKVSVQASTLKEAESQIDLKVRQVTGDENIQFTIIEVLVEEAKNSGFVFTFLIRINNTPVVVYPQEPLMVNKQAITPSMPDVPFVDNPQVQKIYEQFNKTGKLPAPMTAEPKAEKGGKDG